MTDLIGLVNYLLATNFDFKRIFFGRFLTHFSLFFKMVLDLVLEFWF